MYTYAWHAVLTLSLALSDDVITRMPDVRLQLHPAFHPVQFIIQ